MGIKRMFAFLAAFCLCFYTPAYARGASPPDALKTGAAPDADPWYSLDYPQDETFLDGIVGADGETLLDEMAGMDEAATTALYQDALTCCIYLLATGDFLLAILIGCVCASIFSKFMRW